MTSPCSDYVIDSPEVNVIAVDCGLEYSFVPAADGGTNWFIAH